MHLSNLYLIISITVIIISYSSGCRLPNGKTGSCLELKKCEVVRKLSEHARFNTTIIKLIKQLERLCHVPGQLLRVCCPSGSSQSSYKVIQDNRICNDGICLLQNHHYCGKNLVQDRIVNGQDAVLGAWPWIASLFYKTGRNTISVCGGTLISKRYVISAAHCFKDVDVDFVTLGDLDRATNPDCDKNSCAPPIQKIGVERVTIHPNFDSNCQQCLGNDIALIRLNRDVTMYEKYVVPICLPFNMGQTMGLTVNHFPGLDAKAAGWGSNSQDGSINVPNHLQEVDLPMQQTLSRYCLEFQAKWNIKDPNSVFCVGGEGKDICKGDSGGPLMLSNQYKTQDFLIGIASVGSQHCGTLQAQSLFTNVIHYLDWIASNVKP